MYLVSILRESHEANQVAVAHAGLTITIGEKEIILRRDSEPLVRQLSPELAVLLHCQTVACLSVRAVVGKEHHREIAVGQLRQFACPGQRMDAFEFAFDFHEHKGTLYLIIYKGQKNPETFVSGFITELLFEKLRISQLSIL